MDDRGTARRDSKRHALYSVTIKNELKGGTKEIRTYGTFHGDSISAGEPRHRRYIFPISVVPALLVNIPLSA